MLSDIQIQPEKTDKAKKANTSFSLMRVMRACRKYKKGINAKNSKADVDRILELDKDWRGFLGEMESMRAEQNLISKNKNFTQDDIEKAKAIKNRIKHD